MRYSIYVFILLMFIDSCVNRIDFDVGGLNKDVLIINGFISDQQGPYTIELFQSLNVKDNLLSQRPVVAKSVSIKDNVGNSEVLTSNESGIYKTNPDGIRGEVGREYQITIELLDGSIFQSEPDLMYPSGEIDSLYYNWESYTPQTSPTEYGFRVFLDATKYPNSNSFLRWRFTGTFEFRSYPDFHPLGGACTAPPDPLPCSGAVLDGGLLRYQQACSCCICWSNQNESKPHLINTEIVTNEKIKKYEIGFVPFNEYTFVMNKYMVKVEQMSLSPVAYEFWKVIEDQKEGLTSLFQPSFGAIKTNVHSLNTKDNAIGVFYATSIKKRIIFITSKDAPISVPIPDLDFSNTCTVFWDACDKVYIDASRTPPPEWN